MGRDYLFLTGGTGLIGEYLLGDLLGRNVPLCVLARDSKKESAAERVDQTLARWESRNQKELPRPRVITGDLHAEGLGLSPEDRRWMQQHVGRVLHCAASVSFHSTGNQADPLRTNVDGTSRLVELAKELSIDEFHHVSTAYVCGDRSDTIYEHELDAGQRFLSDYEQSKRDAEAFLHASQLPSLTIYRPSVVVGDSRCGYTSTFHGIYQFVKFTAQAQQRADLTNLPWKHRVRIATLGTEHKNLVNVDWVSRCIVELVARPEHHGKTYHLTADQPTVYRDFEEAMRQYFKYEGVEFVGPLGIPESDLSDIEELFYGPLLAGEQRHWRGDPVFDTRQRALALPNLPSPKIDIPHLQRLMDYAVKSDFGRVRTPRRKRVVHSSSL